MRLTKDSESKSALNVKLSLLYDEAFRASEVTFLDYNPHLRL